jgi:hypothetical protein
MTHVTYSNIFTIHVQADGLVRIDFKVANMQGEPHTVCACVYLKVEDAITLARVMTSVLPKPIEQHLDGTPSDVTRQ